MYSHTDTTSDVTFYHRYAPSFGFSSWSKSCLYWINSTFTQQLISCWNRTSSYPLVYTATLNQHNKHCECVQQSPMGSTHWSQSVSAQQCWANSLNTRKKNNFNKSHSFIYLFMYFFPLSALSFLVLSLELICEKFCFVLLRWANDAPKRPTTERARLTEVGWG